MNFLFSIYQIFYFFQLAINFARFAIKASTISYLVAGCFYGPRQKKSDINFMRTKRKYTSTDCFYNRSKQPFALELEFIVAAVLKVPPLFRFCAPFVTVNNEIGKSAW